MARTQRTAEAAIPSAAPAVPQGRAISAIQNALWAHQAVHVDGHYRTEVLQAVVGDLQQILRVVHKRTRVLLNELVVVASAQEAWAPLHPAVGRLGPIMSALRTLADHGDKRPLIFFYGNPTWEDVIYREEIEELEKRLNLKVVHDETVCYPTRRGHDCAGHRPISVGSPGADQVELSPRCPPASRRAGIPFLAR